MGSTDEYIIQQVIDIPEKIEPAHWPECCIYNVPASLREVKKDAYAPLLISIGPVHHGEKELKRMEKQKQRYFHFFWERLVNKGNLVGHREILEKQEQSIRRCYQQEFSDDIKKEGKDDDIKKEGKEPFLSKEQFVSMILLDAVFIMELFLREAKRSKHTDDPIITQPCLSKSIQRDLLLLENQLPMSVLAELYEKVVPCNDKLEHTSFHKLAHEYFKSCYQKSSERKFEPEKFAKSVHFTDFVRCHYLPRNLSYDREEPQHHNHSQKECMLRTATKLNEAGVSFEKVSDPDRCLLDISFENKPFYGWFLCLGCLPRSTCFKARLQFPQLKVDHTTECVLRNLIAFEQCHYPGEPYICNYVSLVDSLIHTKDDAELLVEKEAIVHELGSDKELATLVNSLCKHVVTNNRTCYHQIIGDLNAHYNNPWKWAMGTLRWVYFRDPWRSSSTIVGIAVLIFTIFNFCRVIRVVF